MTGGVGVVYRLRWDKDVLRYSSHYPSHTTGEITQQLDNIDTEGHTIQLITNIFSDKCEEVQFSELKYFNWSYPQECQFGWERSSSRGKTLSSDWVSFKFHCPGFHPSSPAGSPWHGGCGGDWWELPGWPSWPCLSAGDQDSVFRLRASAVSS